MESAGHGESSMDPLIAAAARSLSAGDPLGALNRIALRGDAPALALRGIAMAQIGDLVRARALLRRAGRAFGPSDEVARARCVVAEAEIGLVSRDLEWPPKALAAARALLHEHGDRANAAYARYIEIRLLLLIGGIDEAEPALGRLDPAGLPPSTRTIHEQTAAGVAIRQLRICAARDALVRARRAARDADIPALTAEVEKAFSALAMPAARLIEGGKERHLSLEDVEAIRASGALVVDACRRLVHHANAMVSLATRPVLFELARAMAAAWPADAPREVLIANAFGARHVDESHRARLRVEIARLRAMFRTVADVNATARGFAIAPRRARSVVVLAPPVEGRHSAVLALLADGEAWSSSAVALALGTSQRTAQRALDSL